MKVKMDVGIVGGCEVKRRCGEVMCKEGPQLADLKASRHRGGGRTGTGVAVRYSGNGPFLLLSGAVGTEMVCDGLVRVNGVVEDLAGLGAAAEGTTTEVKGGQNLA